MKVKGSYVYGINLNFISLWYDYVLIKDISGFDDVIG